MAIAIERERLPLRTAVRRDLLNRVRAGQVGLAVFILVAWEAIGRVVGSFFLAPPSEVLQVAGELLSSGELAQAVVVSLITLVIGYGLAVLVGVALGFAMGWLPTLGRVLDPFVNGLYVVPTSALVPVIIIWFGLGVQARVVTVFLFAVFQIVVSTSTGVRNVDQVRISVARSFGATSMQLFRKIAFFDSLPHIFAGLRLGASQAIKGMVVAELLFAATGIGGAIMAAANYYQIAEMFVYIFVIVVMGALLSGAVQLAESYLTRGADQQE